MRLLNRAGRNAILVTVALVASVVAVLAWRPSTGLPEPKINQDSILVVMLPGSPKDTKRVTWEANLSGIDHYWEPLGNLLHSPLSWLKDGLFGYISFHTEIRIGTNLPGTGQVAYLTASKDVEELLSPCLAPSWKVSENDIPANRARVFLGSQPYYKIPLPFQCPWWAGVSAGVAAVNSSTARVTLPQLWVYWQKTEGAPTDAIRLGLLNYSHRDWYEEYARTGYGSRSQDQSWQWKASPYYRTHPLTHQRRLSSYRVGALQLQLQSPSARVRNGELLFLSGVLASGAVTTWLMLLQYEWDEAKSRAMLHAAPLPTNLAASPAASPTLLSLASPPSEPPPDRRSEAELGGPAPLVLIGVVVVLGAVARALLRRGK